MEDDFARSRHRGHGRPRSSIAVEQKVHGRTFCDFIMEVSMLDEKTIRERLASRKAEMARLYGVTKIGLFGSVVRGDQRADSDVDIVVELESENMFRAFFGLKRYLERLLGRAVDLGLEHALKPAIRERVAKEIVYV